MVLNLPWFRLVGRDGIFVAMALVSGFEDVQYPQYIWVNYNDLIATSLEIIVSKGNHPQMGLIQVSEIL